MTTLTVTPAHPPVEKLRDFALGRCGDAELEALAPHVEACPRCQLALEAEVEVEDDPFIARLRAAYAGEWPGGDDRAATGRPDPPPADRAPDRVGDYRIVRAIGSGGMGTVYEAEHLSLRRQVALKLLRAVAMPDPRALARFLRETRAVAQLHHTNIVPLLDAGRDRGHYYYSMPLVAGHGLDQLLRDLGRPGGGPARPAAPAERVAGIGQVATPVEGRVGRPAMSARGDAGERPAGMTGIAGAAGLPGRGYALGVARLGLQVADALAYAHSKGIIHRDIKPSNLILDGEGTVWVTDFGLASSPDDDELTSSGELLGTLRYLAPECFEGRGDARSDLYGLGLTLYEFLALRPAFDAPNGPGLIRQVLEAPVPPPRSVRPGVPRDLETIVLKAIAREPSRRYESAAALGDDLRRFLRGEPIRARPLSWAGRAWRWARRRPAIAGLLVALVLSMVGGTAVSARLAQLAGRRAERARTLERAAVEARDRAQVSERHLGRTTAELSLDEGVRLARRGQVEEGLHWMHAALVTAPDADFRRLARAHLARWGGRIATLTHWIDTSHAESAFAADGATLATAGRAATDGGRRLTIQLWDLATGAATGPSIPVPDLDIRSLAISPDGRTLVAGNGSIQLYQNEPGWATLWDLQGRASFGQVRGHADCVLAVAWAPDGRRFYTGSRDRTVRAWNAATNAPVGGPLRHPGEVRAIAPSPDGRWLLTLCPESAHIWEVATGREVATPLAVPGATPSHAMFTADGGSVVLGRASRDGLGYDVLRQRWDGVAGRLIGEPRVTVQPGGLFSPLPDGRVVAGQKVDPTGTWFLRRGDGVQIFRRPRAVSPPADEIVLADAAPWPGVATAPFDRVAATFYVPVPGQDRLSRRGLGPRRIAATIPHVPLYDRTRLALARDGRLVATVLGEGPREFVQIWRADDGSPVGDQLPQPHAVWALAFSTDGRVLATGGLDHDVTLWDVSRQRPIGPPLPQDDIVLTLEFSPADHALAVGTWKGEVRVWDRDSRTPRYAPLQHEGRVLRVRFSPDGSRLAAVCGGEVTLWDARAGTKVASLKFTRPADPGREEVDPDAVFSPDGRVLLTSPGFGSFRLWDGRTGTALGPPTPAGRSQPPLFAFSPDGSLVVAASEDGSSQVWEAATTRPLGAPSIQPPGVIGVAFRDGQSYLTAARDGSIRSWEVPTPLEGDEATIGMAIRLATGLRRDDGHAIVPLSRVEWLSLRSRWIATQGDTNWALVPPIAPEAWHQARARDARQALAWYALGWHLERLYGIHHQHRVLAIRLLMSINARGRFAGTIASAWAACPDRFDWAYLWR